MSASVIQRCEWALGPEVTRLATGGATVGLAALIVGIAFGFGTVTLGVLAATWLFVTGAATGAVAFSAAVRCSQARWVAVASPAAEAGAAFFPYALGLLAVLLVLARLWMPDAVGAGWGWWISLLVRDLLASALLFVAGRRYVRLARAGDGARSTPAALVYLLSYVAVLSLWAIDLVMNLREWAPSTVIPPYYFMGAFLAGIAWVALDQSVRSRAVAGTRHDLGKLLFAMVIMWGYLLWAAYLPVWYGNIPDETGQLLARWVGGWKFVSLGVLATVLAFPFVFLVPERSKRARKGLAVAAVSILVGLLAEHFLLVLPSLPVHADISSLLLSTCVTLGVLGLFVLALGARLGALKGARPGTG